MVGAGGSRREDAPPSLNSTNVFAALSSLKKKKSTSSSKIKEQRRGGGEVTPEKKEVFWAPAPLTAKSWADVDDEDDDDYYATTAPPDSSWGAAVSSEKANDSDAAADVSRVLFDFTFYENQFDFSFRDGRLGEYQESESDEEEGIYNVEDDAEEEHKNDAEVPTEAEAVVKKLPEPSLATKETERQLSKKELKKKGLEELEAVLAELGYTPRESTGQDDSHGAEKKEDYNGALEKKENATGESKSARKKKKKEKSSKEQKELEDQTDAGNTTSETTGPEKVEDANAGDVKERLKKVASMKKKKSSKEMDAAARAAASEAAARNAKLTAAKKKEKAHYNQQPVR
ncbi:hypothetical protein HN51_059831 [Arachis hypogaea]